MPLSSCAWFRPIRPQPLAVSLLALAALSACGPVYRARADQEPAASALAAIKTNDRTGFDHRPACAASESAAAAAARF
jgi:hypothetical protein